MNNIEALKLFQHKLKSGFDKSRAEELIYLLDLVPPAGRWRQWLPYEEIVVWDFERFKLAAYNICGLDICSVGVIGILLTAAPRYLQLH
ncbi:hypothetical protein S40288_11771 [Stachybotrys chartarum IBT 40288]|nr:hypothetical protein S40288_11771 [Stachybotrys chartarum IBT 40288]